MLSLHHLEVTVVEFIYRFCYANITVTSVLLKVSECLAVFCCSGIRALRMVSILGVNRTVHQS